jgi:hypothetical protein
LGETTLPDVLGHLGIVPNTGQIYRIIFKRGRERGRKTVGSANNIVLAFREQPFRGKNAFFGAV